jgi:AAA domain
MQPITEFNSNLATAILLCGGAGVGKTTLGMRLFPKTYVFVADLNFKSGLDYLYKIKEHPNVIGFDTAAVHPDGKIVPVGQRYSRMIELLDKASTDENVNCIFLDSASFIEDVIKAKICGATNESNIKLSGYDQWGSLVLAWKGVILQLRQSGKVLLMAAHEQKEKDESDGIYKYQIAVDGSIRDKFPMLFSDVWRCEIEENLGKHRWMVRTLGNIRQEHLKRSTTYSNLPAVVLQDDLVKAVHDGLAKAA